MSNEIKTLKGLIELVKHSEEYSRINNPDEITGRIIERAVKIGRKQGALEELEKLLGRLKIGGFIDKEHLWEMIENRIKELEKELLK